MTLLDPDTPVGDKAIERGFCECLQSFSFLLFLKARPKFNMMACKISMLGKLRTSPAFLCDRVHLERMGL